MALVKPDLTKPMVGGSLDVWGDILNSNIDAQDQYNRQIANDNSAKDEELNRLERDKLNKTDLNGLVETTVDNYVEQTTKPQINTYVETVSKPDIDTYVGVKKTEINTYVDTVSKPALNSYTVDKKSEIDTHTSNSKANIDTYVETVSKPDIQNFTTGKVGESNQEITVHTNNEVERINSTGIDGKVPKSTKVIAGKGLTGGGNLGSNVTLNIESTSKSLVVSENSIGINLVNDLVTGGVDNIPSAEQIVVLNRKIEALGSVGGSSDIVQNENFGERRFKGVLEGKGTDISLGTSIYHPELYLDGTRIPNEMYIANLTTGHIKLNKIYSTYSVDYEVIDKYPFHIKFAYSTLTSLLAQTQVKDSIVIGDIIKILGEATEDDGGARLVKCEDSKKLNGIDIGNGRFLNEVPDSRGSYKLDKGGYTGNAQDLKNEIDTKLDKGSYTGNATNLKNEIDTKQNSTDNSLNTTSKNVISAINELNDGKISKTGDTISGALIIETDSYPAIHLSAKNNPENSNKAYMELDTSGNINFISLNSKTNQHSISATLPVGRSGILYSTGFKPIPRDLEYLGTLDVNTTTFDNLRDNTGYYEVSAVPDTVFNPITGVYMFGQLHITYAYYSVLQTYHSHANGWILTRMWWNDAWSPWRKVYTNYQPPTSYEIGAVSKSGDTMTGVLELASSTPYIYFKDTREGASPTRSFIGFGSSAKQRLQIVNNYSDGNTVALEIREDKKLYYDGYTVFDTGNCPILKGETGWQKLPSGLIIQWGTSTTTNSYAGTTLSFPISFSSSNYAITTNGVYGLENDYGVILPITIYERSIGSVRVTAGAKFRISWEYNTNATYKFQWIAIGY